VSTAKASSKASGKAAKGGRNGKAAR
jgi:hypothetical protein